MIVGGVFVRKREFGKGARVKGNGIFLIGLAGSFVRYCCIRSDSGTGEVDCIVGIGRYFDGLGKVARA